MFFVAESPSSAAYHITVPGRKYGAVCCKIKPRGAGNLCEQHSPPAGPGTDRLYLGCVYHVPSAAKPCHLGHFPTVEGNVKAYTDQVVRSPYDHKLRADDLRPLCLRRKKTNVRSPTMYHCASQCRKSLK
ncbi:hypothetical protein Bbelb_407360 [Branchiostoma belcheri]|nr:hypothetical protein Bbelb_407360 [Branchiostoma belcheri]